MRVGVIGSGLQAKRRVPVLQNLPNTEVAVISATNLDNAKRLADPIGCEASVGWESIVSRTDLDAIMVLTPPNSHAAITIASLNAGKHVFCEKPLARTLSEAEAMVKLAEESALTLKCGFNHRHHPAIQQARQWFDEGIIGDAIFLRARYGIGGRIGYEKEWRANTEIVSGGHLMEQGIHAIDLARWFLGDFAEVTAFVETRFWEVRPIEDNGFALYRTSGGVVASIHSSLTQWKNIFSIELYGRDGYINMEGLGGSYGTERATLGKRDFNAPFSQETVEFLSEDQSWLEEWQEFASAIKEGRQPLGNGQDGLEAMRLVFAAYEASNSRTTVQLH